jgi:hypothetical protein
MRIVAFLSIWLCAVPISLYAQLPENPYIGLFADEGRSISCVTGAGFYPVEMWIWCLPSWNGQMCAEFSIQYPGNVIQTTVTRNESIISVELGSLVDGMSVCYKECLSDWNWNYHQTLFVTNSDPSWIEVIPHPDYGGVRFASCA